MQVSSILAIILATLTSYVYSEPVGVDATMYRSQPPVMVPPSNRAYRSARVGGQYEVQFRGPAEDQVPYGRRFEKENRKPSFRWPVTLRSLSEAESNVKDALSAFLAEKAGIEVVDVDHFLDLAFALRMEIPSGALLKPGVNEFVVDVITVDILSSMPQDDLESVLSVVSAIRKIHVAETSSGGFLDAAPVSQTVEFDVATVAKAIHDRIAADDSDASLFLESLYPVIHEIVDVLSIIERLSKDLEPVYGEPYPVSVVLRLLHRAARQKISLLSLLSFDLSSTIADIADEVEAEAMLTAKLMADFKLEYGDIFGDGQFAFWNGAYLISANLVSARRAAVRTLLEIGDFSGLDDFVSLDEFLPDDMFGDELSSEVKAIIAGARKEAEVMKKILGIADEYRELAGDDEFDILVFLESLRAERRGTHGQYVHMHGPYDHMYGRAGSRIHGPGSKGERGNDHMHGPGSKGERGNDHMQGPGNGGGRTDPGHVGPSVPATAIESGSAGDVSTTPTSENVTDVDLRL